MAKGKPERKGAGQKPGDARGRRIQTEEKAKGLIGLEKGKKVEGAAYSVGNYKGKTLNLTKKQIAAKGKKAVAASKQAATSISDTKFEKGKGVTKGGKAFTGKVDLGGGNIAVYVDGKRVRAAKKAAAPSRGGSGGGRTDSRTAVQKAKDKMGKGAGYGKGAGTPSNLTGNSGGAGGPAAPSARSQMAENRRRAQQRRGTNAMYNRGTRVSMSSASPAKEGQRRTRIVNGRKVVEKYSGGKWLPLTGSRGGY